MRKIILLLSALFAITKSHVLKSHQKYDWDLLLNYKFPDSYKNENYLNRMPRAEIEDAYLKFVPLAQKYGYPVEDYTLQTKDGYLINLHRIPHGRKGKPAKSKGVVYMQHGLLESSIDWLIAGPELGFGYILADKGYDVWFGNMRGNRYSKNHTTYDTDSKEFWNFTWHEMGVIDLPMLIDFVLEKTNQQKLIYIGHSQGTTVFYVMCSELPEYNAKIRAHFSLAPIAYMNHMTSPLLNFIAFFDKSVELLLKIIGMNEFLPNDGLIHQIAKFFCHDGIFQPICANTLFLMCGFNKEHLNTTLLPILMEHVPAGASTKQFLHYGQIINSGGILSKGKFRQYDYGKKGNLLHYNQKTPPNYNLAKVTAPVYLFYSNNDLLANPIDVRRLRDELGNCKHTFLVPSNTFNHLDYVFGIGAKDLVYDKVMSLMVRLPK